MPTKRQPSCKAATAVEPEPVNGSRMRLPGAAIKRIRCRISAIDLTVGWLLRSDSVAEMMRQLGGEPVATAAAGQLVADGRYGAVVIGTLARLLSGLRADILALSSLDLVAQNLLIEIATTVQQHLMAVESGQGRVG